MKATIAFLALLGMAVVPALAQSGSWNITNKTSTLDGAQSYTAMLSADNAVTGILGQQKKATLAFACNSKGFFATIVWPDFVEFDATDPYVDVVWKVDSGQPARNSWFASTTAVGQSGTKGLTTLKVWSTGKTLVVRVPDQHGGQETTFTLDGIANVYDTLSHRNCG